jgi:PAS domain S-box-containing protein
MDASMERGCRQRRVAITLAVLLACCPWAFGLDPSLDVSQYAHTTWKMGDAVFKGNIGAIAQTPDGYLWVGTDSGLLRFDGVRAVPWQPPGDQHLPSNNVASLLATRDGTLWIGTWKGLASWKDGKLTLYPDLAGLLILPLLQDREGTVWAGGFAYTPPGKLCAIQNGIVKCYGEDGSLGNGVLGLFEDRTGNLWAGTRTGLWRWKPGPAKFYSLPGEVAGIQGLSEDDNGELLIALRGRIARLVDGKAETVYSYPVPLRQSFSRTLLRDRDGGFWIGLGQGLVHVHQGRTDTFAQTDGLSGDQIMNLFEDREGNIWVATAAGLDRFRHYAVVTYSVKEDLPNLAVSVLTARDGSVWVDGSERLTRWTQGQVTIFSGRRVRAARPFVREVIDQGLPSSELVYLSLLQDHGGRIWIAGPRGVRYLDNDRFTSIRGIPGGIVYSIAEDTGGNLWFANLDHGLLELHGDRVVEQIPWAGLGHKDQAMAVAADPVQGGLWLGFFQGGVAYLKDGQVRASYTATDGLGEGTVSDLHLDEDGTLWVATEGGLSRFKKGSWATLSSKNGLPCDAVIWTIKDDDNSLWLYMACGLVRIAHSELKAWDTRPNQTIQATIFDNSDGMQSRAASSPSMSPKVGKSPDGKIWFTTFSSISVVHPRHLPFNKLPPQVHIEQVVANHKSYPVTSDANGNVRLPPRIRDLEIDYTALSFVVPEKVLFRYKLEGWDRDWQDAGTRRQAFYNNLPPRNYRFRVMACNNSGVWSEAGTFLDFSIAPAYYQTWWFRSLCLLAFLALVYGAYRVRVGQLRAQEEKFRETIESIPAMAFVSLPDGYRTFVNKGWVEYTGMTVEQSLGSGWHAVIHPEDFKRVLGEWEPALASGKPMYYEARYRRAEDGQYRWFMVRVVPQRNKRGKIVKWFGTLTDIEDRKRAEQALRSSDNYLTEAQRLTHTGSCAIDGTSRESVYWSDEMFRLFGFDPQQGLPMFDQWLQRIHAEDRDKVKLASEKTFLTKVNCDVEFRIVKPDGTVKHIHGIGHPVLSTTGELVQVLGTMVDVTERKRAEEARDRLRQLEADLAHINRVSTLGEMAASLAHEIKQPIAATITSANSCIEWLAQEPPNLDRARAAAARIDKYGNRAAETIDRIRSFYKKSSPQRELVDVNGIIHEMLTLLKCEADEYSVAMRTELAADLPEIMADRVQLQQVLMNLMVNGIEAMKDSGGELTVKSHLQGGQLQFSVSDTGVGLPTEKMDQIFSAFFTTKPQGSGMGLAISRSIVESHGGRLWAAANDGRGATFHFTLPTAAEILQVPATGT